MKRLQRSPENSNQFETPFYTSINFKRPISKKQLTSDLILDDDDITKEQVEKLKTLTPQNGKFLKYKESTYSENKYGENSIWAATE